MPISHDQDNLFEQIRIARKNMAEAQRALTVEGDPELEKADPGSLVKVRNQNPVEIWYATGSDARECRERAGEQQYVDSHPCFVTFSLGGDGFIWETCDEVDEAIDELSRSIAGYVMTSEAARKS
jgi:hypothetical protein